MNIFLDLRENVIAWALQDVDSDGDGRVSLVEFMADYMTKPTDGLEFYGDDHVEQEKDKFKEDFDMEAFISFFSLSHTVSVTSFVSKSLLTSFAPSPLSSEQSSLSV